MDNTVKYSPWTWTFYRIDFNTLGGLKIDILCYFTSWFMFTFTLQPHGHTQEQKSGTPTLKQNPVLFLS